MPSNSSSDQKRSLWIRADLPESWEERKALISAGARSQVDLVVVREEDLDRVRSLGVGAIGAMVEGESDLPKDVLRILPAPGEVGDDVGVSLVRIQGKDDQNRAMRIAGVATTLVVDCKNWKVIPLENLVAACQETGCRLIAYVRSHGEAEIALSVLERGVDGVLLENLDPNEVEKTSSLLGRAGGGLGLVEAEVVSATPVGSGDRACIDTCSMLDDGEGLLIGSQANGMVLVHAETVTTEYVESRPFRVNAGAIHSYVLDLDNKTRYLSDLRAGDQVMVVGADGSTRVVTVGRVKIETRPLCMIELRRNSHMFKVILQDAETIRLVNPNREPVSIKDIKPGDRVLAYVSGSARHFGMAIEEKIIER